MLRVRVVLSGFSGGPGLSTFYFTTPLEDTAAAVRVVDRVQAFFATDGRAMFYNPTTISVSGDVDVITAATGLITNMLAVPPPAVIQGFGGGQATSQATAGNLRLSTGTFVAGRRLRGRIFISPLATSAVESDGTATVQFAAAGFTAANAILLNLEPGDQWVVWHRPKLGAGGSVGPVISASLADRLAVLTSRRG